MEQKEPTNRELQQDIRRVEARLGSLEKNSAESIGHFDQIENQLDDLENRFTGMEVRFDGLEGRFTGMEVRFDGLEQRFDGLEDRFDGLENTVNGHTVDIHVILTTLQEHSTMHAEHNRKFDAIFTILDRIDKTTRDTRQEQVAMIDWLKRHDTHLEKHDQEIAALQPAV